MSPEDRQKGKVFEDAAARPVSDSRRRAQDRRQSPHAHGQVALDLFERAIEMTRSTSTVFYVAALIVVIVGVDLLFFKHRVWERLMVNIGIVLVFTAFYLRFLKHT